jgi:hypothetical protein
MQLKLNWYVHVLFLVNDSSQAIYYWSNQPQVSHFLMQAVLSGMQFLNGDKCEYKN